MIMNRFFILALSATTSCFALTSFQRTQRIVGDGSAFSRRSTTLFGTANDEDASWDLSLFSPAKINIFLRIIRKREDGFHDLASLFQTVGFGDYLHFKKLDSTAKEDILTCNMEGVPTDSSNLVLRAIELLRNKCDINDQYFEVDLVKHVPHQAGLGGGSGNAAAALYGANELLGNPATLEQLVEWSGDLGSDITFFLSRGTAYCTGRGEIMTPVDPLPNSEGQKLCIVKPDIGLSTPSVFKALDYDKLSTADPEEVLKVFQRDGIDTEEKDEVFINDLEAPAFKVLPELDALKNDLKSCGFKTVMMSGSGTSIFCIGSENVDSSLFDEIVRSREDVSVFETEFINRSEEEWFVAP